MPGPSWSDDAPGDEHRIAANCRAINARVYASAPERDFPDATTAKTWHAHLYAGCTVPSPCYVGNFRGDSLYPDLVDYEVGVGPLLSDGYTECVGVWSSDVAAAVEGFLGSLHEALRSLDTRLAPGVRLTESDDLRQVVALIAIAHGEWVRIHPFSNGNGRTARLWAAFVALRYGLPAFVTLKPRPGDVAYARAAKKSMGRPPDFVGDHHESIAVFSHLLALHLLA